MITAAIWLVTVTWGANAASVNSRLLQYAMRYAAAICLTIAVNP